MKKLLGILVLGLLLIIFSGTAQAGCTLAQINSGEYKMKTVDGKTHCVKRGFFDNVGDALEDLNPISYFEKRKKCQDQADRMDTVAIGKRYFKHCMKD